MGPIVKPVQIVYIVYIAVREYHLVTQLMKGALYLKSGA